MTSHELPPPNIDQAYCDVSALLAGTLVIPCWWTVADAGPDETLDAPALGFLATHSRTKERLVFDLGIRKDTQNLPQPVVDRAVKMFQCHVPEDAVDALAKGGLKPGDIAYVCLSHCHWDHTGNPALFPKSKVLVGAESRELFNPGYPADPTSTFASDLLPEGRTEFLQVDDKWVPIGPFPRALDFYGDGSLYIVDAPGHLPGHVNLLARTSADGGWVYLAGDSAHDWRLVRGTGQIAVLKDAHGKVTSCAHLDKEAAEETIRRIAALTKIPRVQVILAHDAEFYVENKDKDSESSAFWPGKIASK